MADKLTLKTPNLPLKAYPKGQLKILLEGTQDKPSKFLVWISDLLGLTGEDAAKRLILALPAVEKHFWSLGFNEIQKAFEMYADGQLKTQPLPNYFTRILVGQIFKEYKEQQPIKKKEIKMPELTQEEKDNLIYHGVVTCFDHYIQFREVIDGKVWVHDHLDELGLINLTKHEKKALWDKSLVSCKNYAKAVGDHLKSKTMLLELENKNASPRINEYKKLRMFKLFDVLEAKGKHIKDLL